MRFLYQSFLPRMRYLFGFPRAIYHHYTAFQRRMAGKTSAITCLPASYQSAAAELPDIDLSLKLLEGKMPKDVRGAAYFVQCQGAREAYMVGDTHVVRLDIDGGEIQLKRRWLDIPDEMTKRALADTRYKFDFMGLMHWSPGLGISTYKEGIHLLPDGRLAISSDLSRPWVINPKTLGVETPIGWRKDWLPMMEGFVGKSIGSLFPGYPTSHAIAHDYENDELFLVSFQMRGGNKRHPVYLMKWDGKGAIQKWLVKDQAGEEIEVKQSLHEIAVTRKHVVLADTAFIGGGEMFVPWMNAPKVADVTRVFVVEQNSLVDSESEVFAREFVIDEAAIHLLAGYEEIDDQLMLIMLHTPVVNTAEVIRYADRNLADAFYPERVIGYGPVPSFFLGSMGKHLLDMGSEGSVNSTYLSKRPNTWSPYLYTYAKRQASSYRDQDFFVMSRGFNSELVPKRVMKHYGKEWKARSDENLYGALAAMNDPASISRIDIKDLRVVDDFLFPPRLHLYSILHVDNEDGAGSGYLLAAVAVDSSKQAMSSGHEYWVFDAKQLSKGPIAKLGHERLDHTTLFHGVFVNQVDVANQKNDRETYIVDRRQDFTEEELSQWGKTVVGLFSAE